MNTDLIGFARQFIYGKMSASEFADEYIERWKSQRDDGTLLLIPNAANEVLSTIFCFADLYNPGSDREEYEFDEEKLKHEIQNVLLQLPPEYDEHVLK